jgi:hypothetical protein
MYLATIASYARLIAPLARKGSKCWRYYVSQAVLQADKSKAGSIARVPASDVEALVSEAVGKLSLTGARQADIRDLMDRVTIGGRAIQVQLSEAAEAEGDADERTKFRAAVNARVNPVAAPQAG